MKVQTAALVAISGLCLFACDRKPGSKTAPPVNSSAVKGAARREFPHDPKAHDVLRQFSDFMSASHSFQVKISMLTQFRGTGLPDLQKQYELYRDPDDRVALVLTAGVVGPTIVCDGRQLYVLEKPGNRYLLDPAPPTLGKIPTIDVIGGRNSADLNCGIAPLFQKDAHAYLTRTFEIGRLLPDADIDGTACHRIEMAGPEFERVLWIERGERPVLRRVTATTWETGDVDRNNSFLITNDFRDWQFDMPIPDSVFMIQPPANARRTHLPMRTDVNSGKGEEVDEAGVTIDGEPP